MKYHFISFFLSNEEQFLTFNKNIFETNVVNIFILLGLLFYINKTSLASILEKRRKAIIETIENAENDVIIASDYYLLAEKTFTESLFLLHSWNSFYKKDKMNLVIVKYNLVKTSFLETFQTTDNLIKNFEKKTFLLLQNYIFLTLSSKLIKNFIGLSEKEKSTFLELTFSKIKAEKNDF